MYDNTSYYLLRGVCQTRIDIMPVLEAVGSTWFCVPTIWYLLKLFQILKTHRV